MVSCWVLATFGLVTKTFIMNTDLRLMTSLYAFTLSGPPRPAGTLPQQSKTKVDKNNVKKGRCRTNKRQNRSRLGARSS